MLRRTFTLSALALAASAARLRRRRVGRDGRRAEIRRPEDGLGRPDHRPRRPPKARRIVVLAGDMKNGGILGVTNGVEEAAGKIGWEVTRSDGAGSVQSRARRPSARPWR